MPSSITPGPAQLKALTHPVRVRMLGLLRVEGPATATTLATRLGLNTGATSYHLRQLAEHGFIEDDAERGNRRERWWRAAHSSTVTAPAPRTGSPNAAAVDAYLQSVLSVYAELSQRALEERPLLPPAWRDAGTMSDCTVRLTPARALEVVQQVERLLQDVHDQDDPEAEAFVVQYNAYAYPGRLARDTQEES